MNHSEPADRIQVERSFQAAPERVFDAWLEPEIAGQFLFATPEGEMVRAEVDARAGGKLLFVDRRAGEDVAHVGEYQEIRRPSRLAFAFAVPKYSDAFTTVRLDIVPTVTGSHLTLSHEGVPADWREKTREGWVRILEQLDRVLSR